MADTAPDPTVYNFDQIIDRKGTECDKYDLAAARGHADDELPMWVADMDLRIPGPAIDALHERVDHGIFGYSVPNEAYYDSVLSWIGCHQGWAPRREWLVKTPGVVFSLAQAVRAFSRPGQAVLIQRPVYYPFTNVITANDRIVANAPLVYDRPEGSPAAGSYRIDFEAFDRELERSQAKLFLLCNPHNPSGRVWTRGELTEMARICKAHGCVVFSDEIHADFARPGFTHTSWATLGPEYLDTCLIATSPTKTFNIAGLQISNIFVPNPDLRARFERAIAQTGYDEMNAMGFVAARACYERGEAWLTQLKAYLEGNYACLSDFLARRCPELKLVELQSTYLPWVDCRDLGLSDAGLQDFVQRDAKLWLDLGPIFGPEGSGFIRINIACPRVELEETLRRLEHALLKWRAAR